MPGRLDKFYAIGGVFVRALYRLVQGLILARAVGPDLFGQYVLVLSLEEILATVSGSLFSSPLATLIPGTPEAERPALLRLALKRQCVVSVIGFVGYISLWGWAVPTRVDAQAYIAFSIYLLATGPMNLLRAWRNASFQANAAFWTEVWAQAIPVAAVAGGVMLRRWGVWHVSDLAILVAFLVSMGVAAGVICWSLVPSVSAAFAPAPLDAAIRKRYTGLGMDMSFGAVVGGIATRLQPAVLAQVAQRTQVAVFGACRTVVAPVRLVGVSLSAVLRPRLSLYAAKGQIDQVHRVLRLALLAGGACGAVFIVASIFFGQEISRAMFGARFANIGLEAAMPWAAAFAAVEALAAIIAIALQTEGLARRVSFYRGITGALSLMLLYPAAKWYGATGAFVAILVSESVFLALGVLLLRRSDWSAADARSATQDDLSAT